MPPVQDNSTKLDDLQLLLPRPESDQLDSYRPSPVFSRSRVASRLAQRVLAAGLTQAVEERVRAHGLRMLALLSAESAGKRPAPEHFNPAQDRAERGRLCIRTVTIRLPPAALGVLEKITELSGLRPEAVLGHLLLAASEERLLEMLDALSRAHQDRIQEIGDDKSFARIVAREAARRSPIV